MALSTVEDLSRILIQAGASRTARDLVGNLLKYVDFRWNANFNAES